ncbi:MAG: hypothetical protein EHM78_02155 [Myxococcaceae bacterium]|nr:MAG: hypothetical protein EHM78_02155 [Myxococcaceae bacterium]
MPIQTEYVETIRPPGPGTVHGSYDVTDAFTGNCEPETGIPFGRAVSRGTIATFGDNAVILGGDLALYRGASIRDITMRNSYATDPDKYERYQNVGVLRRGMMWLEPAVAVNAGDPVHFDGTTGIFSNTGGVGPLKGARWETSALVNGRAIAYFPGLEKNDGV